jgi:hypothetical protein
MESELPNRKYDRKLKVLPRVQKSNTLNVLPNRVVP